jgi:hypothetical protein
MKKTLAALVFLAGFGAVIPAHAVVVISSTQPGVLSSGGLEVTFDTSGLLNTSPTGVLPGSTGSFSGGGTVRNGTTTGYAAPAGDVTNYLAIQAGQQEFISFGTTVQYFFGFLLGSADTYNTFVFKLGGTTEGSFTGAQLLSPGNGDQFSPLTNGYVNFTGAFDTVILGTGDTNALEIDNISSAVPEASTWAMMIFGFLGVGFLAYRRKGTAFRLA